MIDQHINQASIINIGGEFAALSIRVVNNFWENCNQWISRCGGREYFELAISNQQIAVYRVYHRDYDMKHESQTSFIVIEIIHSSEINHNIMIMQSIDLLVNDMLSRKLGKEEIISEFIQNLN